MGKLADLLSNEGWEALCRDLGFEGESRDRSKVQKTPGILLSKISHTQLLAKVLDDQGPAMAMLSEVMGFLERHGHAARTTGTIATLPGIEELKPQHRKTMANWDQAAMQRLAQNGTLEEMWEVASTALDDLLDDASTENPGSWRLSRYGGIYERRQGMTTYDEDIIDILRQQIALVRESLPKIDSGEFIGGVVEKCDELEIACDDLTENHYQGYHSHNDHEEALGKIAIFVEQMRLTATLLSDIEGAAALIELAVFRNLPQLYEVWLLCFVLRTLECAGYTITLENVGQVEDHKVWNLKYAGARTPVAKIGSQAWAFFQFKAKAGSTMPDFAIYDNSDAVGSAVIVLDAKFSEKGGYNASDYRATLDKYKNLSQHRFTVEYMVRSEITPEVGMMFGVCPGMPAIEDLKRALFEAFTTQDRPAVAVIDCSESFADKLPDALERLQTWVNAGLLRDEFIVFAGRAELRQGLGEQIGANAITLEGNEATRIADLVGQLGELRNRAEPLDVVLLSDGEFEDGSVDSLYAATERLWAFGLPVRA
ncbi:hypothetical protein AEAC466_19900 [Asticcacaulis sp. AC466]|nr:hypothetical protein AEAC466_19900 [Asticcacaulis sp. AC466]